MGPASVLPWRTLPAPSPAACALRERAFALSLKAVAAEALHTDHLISGAQKTLAARKKEKVIIDEQAKRNSAVLDYLGSKFTREALYLTMAGQPSNMRKQ